MTNDIGPLTKTIKRELETLGYRVCVALDNVVWICSAKHDAENQFFIVRADTELKTITELASSVGYDFN